MESEPRHLFVYGTLRPGEVRWPILASFVVGEGHDDAVAGSLFDTGAGYPAALFGGEHRIHGRTYELVADSIGRCLELLDEEEGAVDGLYHRVAVRSLGGTDVWAYQYGGGLTLTRIESGDWLQRD